MDSDEKQTGQLLQSTINVIILLVLDKAGPQQSSHIRLRLQQLSQQHLVFTQGTLYTLLGRLEELGWIRSTRALTNNGNKAVFYSITQSGIKALKDGTDNQRRLPSLWRACFYRIAYTPIFRSMFPNQSPHSAGAKD